MQPWNWLSSADLSLDKKGSDMQPIMTFLENNPWYNCVDNVFSSLGNPREVCFPSLILNGKPSNLCSIPSLDTLTLINPIKISFVSFLPFPPSFAFHSYDERTHLHLDLKLEWNTFLCGRSSYCCVLVAPSSQLNSLKLAKGCNFWEFWIPVLWWG